MNIVNVFAIYANHNLPTFRLIHQMTNEGHENLVEIARRYLKTYDGIMLIIGDDFCAVYSRQQLKVIP